MIVRQSRELSSEYSIMKEIRCTAESMSATTTDSILLAEYIQPRRGERLLEIGCGEGDVSLLISCKHDVEILAIDISGEAVRKAREKAAHFHTNIPGHVTFEFKALEEIDLPESRNKYDVVFCNPPFYSRGRGRVSPVNDRARARQEISLSLTDIFAVSGRLLKPEGRLCLIHTAERLDEIILLGNAHGLPVRELRPVYTAPGKPAKRVLVTASKTTSRGVKILDPVLLY